MRLALPSSVAVLMLAVPALAQVPGGYAGQQTREIKALSAQEQADLLAGRGMGLARAGELNHHPGPAHVLEMRDKLELTLDQLAAVQASFRRMEAAAKPLGTELVQRERELDAAFQQGAMTPARLAADTEEIGTLQGRLRGIHLAAHLEMRAVLTPQQVTAYDALRGYADGAAPSPHGHHKQPG
jgi:Spy/CpxP family protein refolding chaperone